MRRETVLGENTSQSLTVLKFLVLSQRLREGLAKIRKIHNDSHQDCFTK